MGERGERGAMSIVETGVGQQEGGLDNEVLAGADKIVVPVRSVRDGL